MKNKLIVTGLLVALAFSCLAQRKKKIENNMNSWLGHTKQELLLSWGMPARETEDGNGGQIVAFTHGGSTDGINLGYGNRIPPDAWYDYRIFYINAEGRIYSWRTKREHIPPQQIDLRVYHY